MKFILCDQNADALRAWRAQFLKRPEVDIRDEDIFGTEADSLLVPGNSFGFLDSTVELRVAEAYGLPSALFDDGLGAIVQELDEVDPAGR